MKNNKNYYSETVIDSNRVIEAQGAKGILLVQDSKGLLIWVDKYQLLAKQDAQVDKAKIGDLWYKYVESVFCLDLRATQGKKTQLLLNQFNS